MPEYPEKQGIVHERVAFGEKSSKVERRSGAGSHQSGTLTKYALEHVETSKTRQARNAVRPRRDLKGLEKPSIVHERVAFGEKTSKVERRSGAGLHRSGTITKYARERVDAAKTRLARNSVRPRRGLVPDPRAKEY
jgi:hypothetical protein